MAPQSHVLVSGGSGFVASHIISLLIAQKYAVTATVRAPAKGTEILNLHPEGKDNLTFAYVPDIAVEGAFDSAFKSAKTPFTYVIHTSSPVNFSVKDFKRDLVDPAVQGTLSILHSLHTHSTPSIRRLILLGSAVAILNSFANPSIPGRSYTSADWNPVTLSSATSPVLAYIYAKKAAELAAREFVRDPEKKCTFDMAVINPDVIIGPMIQPMENGEKVNQTNMGNVYAFLNGRYKIVEKARFAFYQFVDVRDVAEAHVRAMTIPEAGGKPLILVSGTISPRLVCEIIGRRFPDLSNRLPKDWDVPIIREGFLEGITVTGWDGKETAGVLSSRGEEWGYRWLEESVVDTVESLLGWEEKWGAGG